MNKVNWLKVIQDIVDRRLTTHLAAEHLGISDRHCHRLLQHYRTDGLLGMADRRRGKPSNYRLPAGIAERAVQIFSERYSDFGPTLACEKLTELHGVVFSKETVRKLIMQSGLWIPSRQHATKIQ
jgi:transposase